MNAQKRVVVTDYSFPSLGAEAAAARAAGAEFSAHQCETVEDVRAALTGATIGVVQNCPVDAAAIAGMAEGARLIVYGIGFDNIDVSAARQHRVEVAHVPDYCIDEVSDHAAAMIYALGRRLPALDGCVRGGAWDAIAVMKPLNTFRESTLGFIGLGRIGRAVMYRLRPCGFDFVAFDPVLEKEGAAVAGVESVSLDEVARRADVITLHAPLTPRTKHIVGEAFLSKVKPTAIIVNTARGGLVDLDALVDALREGRICAAGLDVFPEEPLPIDSPVRGCQNVLLSPHAAWFSDQAIERLQSFVAEEITRGLSGDPPRCPVPPSG